MDAKTGILSVASSDLNIALNNVGERCASAISAATTNNTRQFIAQRTASVIVRTTSVVVMIGRLTFCFVWHDSLL